MSNINQSATLTQYRASQNKRQKSHLLISRQHPYKSSECHRCHRAGGGGKKNLAFSIDLTNLSVGCKSLSIRPPLSNSPGRSRTRAEEQTRSHVGTIWRPKRFAWRSFPVKNCCYLGGVTVKTSPLFPPPTANGGGGEREREEPHSAWRVRALHNCRHAAN